MVTVSYSYNLFYHIFNPTLFKGQTGEELAVVLASAINRMNRTFMTLETSKDVLKALPGNYVDILMTLLQFAKRHPSWIFQCDG